MPNLDRLIAMQNSMAISLVLSNSSTELYIHYFGIEQRQQPAQRAYEALRLACSPIHVLGPIERSQLFGQLRLEHSRGRLAFAQDAGSDVFAFCSRGPGQSGNFDPGLLRKCMSGRSGLAPLEGYARGRPGKRLFQVRLLAQDSCNPHGESAPRRGALHLELPVQETFASEQ